MNDFYLISTSNSSMRLFPENALSHFRNEVPEAINLTEGYEIGLAEVFIPNRIELTIRLPVTSYITLTLHYKNEDGKVIIDRANKNKRTYIIALQEVYHRNITALLEYINKQIQKILKGEKHQPILMFKEGRFLFAYENDYYECVVEFSTYLKDLFGFNRQQQGWLGVITAENYRSLSQKIDYAYIYCNLVTHTWVGDKKVPLIKIITLSNTEQGKILHSTFSKIQYYPLATNKIQTIEFEIRTESGQYVPFQSDGRVMFTLHIRTRKRINID